MKTRTPICASALLVALGCGARDAEWQRARGDIARLRADLEAASARHAEDERRFAAAQQQIDELKAGFAELRAAMQQPAPPPAPAWSPPPASLPGPWTRIETAVVTGEPTCTFGHYVAFEAADAKAPPRHDGSLRTAFTKLVFASKKACPKEANSEMVDRARFECSERTLQVLDGYSVDWNSKKTDFSADGTIATVLPDEPIADKEWTYVCGVK